MTLTSGSEILEIADPVTDRRWADVAELGDLFSSPAWLAVLRDGYRLSLKAQVISSDGVVKGGAAWAEVNDVRGRRNVMLPFSDFADPPGSLDAKDLNSIVQPLVASGLPLSMKLLRQQAPGPEVPELNVVGEAAWHMADLPDGEEELWDQIKSGARQNIRKARRNGVEVEQGSTLELLRAFRELHVGLRKRKYRMLAQPTRFFDAIDGHFGPNGYRVILAKIDGEVAAGVVLIRHGDRAYYKFNASSGQALAARGNDLVMWESMVASQQWGCSSFDFGVSDLDQPGLIRYKNKYATQESRVVTLKSRSPEPRLASRVVSRGLPKLTDVLTSRRCPDRVTARGGDLLYRFFC